MSPPPIQSAARYYIAKLSLGNSIAIAFAFGFFVLFSTLLASYICFRHRHINQNLDSPRIIIVGGGSSENIDEIWVVGLDRSEINSCPKFPFSKGIVKDIDSTCAICLSEYREAEMMRMLPDCKHCFHLNCLDAWLELNGSCPVCRNLPLLTPVSTPLAGEPPSQYSDNHRLRHMAEANEPGPSQARAES